MSATVLQFPSRFSREDEITIHWLLKAGNAVDGIRPGTKAMFLALCGEGREARMELIFQEADRRALAMLEAGNGRF